ncbi:hypothetical protein KR074_006411 [Drosophila pseudoananassae]|nr:hypothetical protein KR074_006411 [Drosophila pseudoananassae]
MSNYYSSSDMSISDSYGEPSSRNKRSPTRKMRSTSQKRTTPSRKRTQSQPQNSKSMRDGKSYKDQGTKIGSKSRRDSQATGSSGGSRGRQIRCGDDTPYSLFLSDFRNRYGNYYKRDAVTEAAKKRWCDMANNHIEPPKDFFLKTGGPNALHAKTSDTNRAPFSYGGIDIESGPASSKDMSFGSVDDGECCMKKKKPAKMCKSKPKKKVCAKKPKCAKPKPKCRKPKRKNPCRRAPACPKRKPRCPKPKPKCQKPKPACPRPC